MSAGMQMPQQSAPVADTVNGFCSSLKIGRTTFYKLVREKRIKLIRLGGRSLVLHTERDRLLSELLNEAA